MFAAMASVALASCTKNEPAASVEQGEAIKFEPVVGVPTKVAEISGTTYDEDSFSVYAWYSAGAFAGTGTKYMSNVAATLVEAGNLADGTDYYAPSTDYYWPKTGNLSFIAYSPTALPAGSSLGDMTGTGTMVVNYVCPTDPAEQVDLLYSDWAVDKTSSTGAAGGYAGVDIAFNHALSVVKFAFKGSSDAVAANIQLTDVQLTDVKTKGTLTCTWAANPTAVWSGQDTKSTFDVLIPTSYQLLATASAASQANNLILIPQELEAKLVVSYKIKSPVQDNGEDVWISQTPVTLNLSEAKVGEDELDEWNMNTKYTYTIVFDLDKVYFAPAVKEYITPEVAGSLSETL